MRDLTFGKLAIAFFGTFLFIGIANFLDYSRGNETFDLIFNGFAILILAIGAVMLVISLSKYLFNNFFRIVATIGGMVAVWHILGYIL